MEYGRIVLLCRQRPHGGRRRSRRPNQAGCWRAIYPAKIPLIRREKGPKNGLFVALYHVP